MTKKEFENIKIEIINCNYDILTIPSPEAFYEGFDDIGKGYYEL